jgi:hypothetical protein
MMTRNRARSFQLESLEGKQLLSMLHPAHHATSKPAPLVLDGTLRVSESQSDGPFSGEIKSLGHVQASTVGGLSFLDGPQPTATEFVVEGAKGSVTLSYGPKFLSEKVTPTVEITRYHYTVVSGTGAYTGASGTGIFTGTGPDGFVVPPNASVTISLHTTRSS